MRDGPVRDIGGVRRSGHPWTIRSRISERSALFRAVHAPAHARRLRSCSRRGRGRTPRSGRRRRPGALTAPRVSAAGRRRSRACRPTEKAVAHDARHGAARPGFTSTVGPRRPSRHPGGSRAGPGACRPWRSPPTRARWRPSRRRPRSRRTRRDRRRTDSRAHPARRSSGTCRARQSRSSGAQTRRGRARLRPRPRSP
jgi:hypothetical protein